MTHENIFAVSLLVCLLQAAFELLKKVGKLPEDELAAQQTLRKEHSVAKGPLNRVMPMVRFFACGCRTVDV